MQHERKSSKKNEQAIVNTPGESTETPSKKHVKKNLSNTFQTDETDQRKLLDSMGDIRRKEKVKGMSFNQGIQGGKNAKGSGVLEDEDILPSYPIQGKKQVPNKGKDHEDHPDDEEVQENDEEVNEEEEKADGDDSSSGDDPSSSEDPEDSSEESENKHGGASGFPKKNRVSNSELKAVLSQMRQLIESNKALSEQVVTLQKKVIKEDAPPKEIEPPTPVKRQRKNKKEKWQENKIGGYNIEKYTPELSQSMSFNEYWTEKLKPLIDTSSNPSPEWTIRQIMHYVHKDLYEDLIPNKHKHKLEVWLQKLNTTYSIEGEEANWMNDAENLKQLPFEQVLLYVSRCRKIWRKADSSQDLEQNKQFIRKLVQGFHKFIRNHIIQQRAFPHGTYEDVIREALAAQNIRQTQQQLASDGVNGEGRRDNNKRKNQEKEKEGKKKPKINRFEQAPSQTKETNPDQSICRAWGRYGACTNPTCKYEHPNEKKGRVNYTSYRGGYSRGRGNYRGGYGRGQGGWSAPQQYQPQQPYGYAPTQCPDPFPYMQGGWNSMTLPYMGQHGEGPPMCPPQQPPFYHQQPPQNQYPVQQGQGIPPPPPPMDRIPPRIKDTCQYEQCANRTPHAYWECKDMGRTCQLCKQTGHQRGRCPQATCATCHTKGVEIYSCPKCQGGYETPTYPITDDPPDEIDKVKNKNKRQAEGELNEDLARVKLRRGSYIVTEELNKMVTFVDTPEIIMSPNHHKDISMKPTAVSSQLKLGSKRVKYPKVKKVINELNHHKNSDRQSAESSEPNCSHAREPEVESKSSNSVMIENACVTKSERFIPPRNKAGYCREGNSYSTSRARVNNISKKSQAYIPPIVNLFPRFIIAVTIEGHNHLRMIDSGADCSVIGINNIMTERRLTSKPTLSKWRGNISTLHGEFKTLGEWKENFKIDQGQSGARFCVVKEQVDPPILGLDWMEYYKAHRDWDTNELVWTDPLSQNECRSNIIDSISMELRVNKSEKIKKNMMKQVTVKAVGARPGCTWFIEPSFLTAQGTIRVERQCVNVITSNELPVWISNWSTEESVSINQDAFIAMGTKEFNLRGVIEEQSSHNTLQSEIYSDGVIKKARIHKVSKSRDPVRLAKCNVNKVKSYQEMMEGILDKEDINKAKIAEDFPDKVKEECKQFIKGWAKVFAENPMAPPAVTDVEMQIPIDNNAIPIKDTPTRMSPEQYKIVEEHVSLMLTHNIIEETTSPWGARVVLAKKKDGKWRFCVDYRYLNSISKKDAYPLPRIDDTLEALGNETAKIFSSLDVASGYWHIPIAKEDREKTAFTTRNGQYQFKVVPFGLTGAPGAFCRYMDKVLRDVMWKRCLVYVDDIIVWAKDINEHKVALSEIFERLLNAGLKLKLSKCEFFTEKVEYLGFVIQQGVVGLSPERVKSIIEIPPPRNVKSLQRFLGAVNWVGRWIKNKAALAAPLTKLLCKDYGEFEIHIEGSEQNQAFKSLKKALSTFPV